MMCALASSLLTPTAESCSFRRLNPGDVLFVEAMGPRSDATALAGHTVCNDDDDDDDIKRYNFLGHDVLSISALGTDVRYRAQGVRKM